MHETFIWISRSFPPLLPSLFCPSSPPLSPPSLSPSLFPSPVQYDEYKTPMDNIGMQDSLLSRFDIIFVVLDEVSWMYMYI